MEVTSRTIQSRFLLRPSPELNEIIVGALGRARELYPVDLCGAAFLSNHYHLLLRVPDAKLLSKFMNHFNSNLAREVGRRTGWKDKIWARRYQSILVSDEEAAQVDRLKYLLSHGVKEGLVRKPEDWPGVSSVRALRDGVALQGYWFDRTKEYAARNQNKEFGRLDFATEYQIEFVQLPCWQDLPEAIFRERIRGLLREIEAEGAKRREETGVEPPGPSTILKQQPESRPMKTKKSPAPLFHAATRKVWQELWEAYALFVAAFRDAAEKWRAGDRTVQFPAGSFPPAPPFAGLVPSRAP